MSVVGCIIGRPNVGKSTLFNRLTESNEAIVDATPGVTRDRHYGKVEWNDSSFTIIDTGGYMHNSDDAFEKYIHRQIQLAINESRFLIFVVDVKDGITDWDKDVAQLVRKSNKPVFLVINKVDNSALQNHVFEFEKFGFKKYYPISAISGSGTGELLDDIINWLKSENINEEYEELFEKDIPKIAIVGRPNVGKSSLINALAGEDNHIVSEIAGTTRDSSHTLFNKFNHKFYLIDTAGLRKKSKVIDDIEFYSTIRTLKAIEMSDVCVLMIDAQQGIEAQDLHIFQNIIDNKKGVVIAVNKWDLIDNKKTNSTKEFEDFIKKKIAPFRDVPIIFTSVPEKQRLVKILDICKDVYAHRRQKIATHELNEYFLNLIHDFPPPAIKGKLIKIKYITQVNDTPIFLFFCNLPQYVQESYKRFLENKLREQYTYTGIPVFIVFKKK